MGEVGKRRLLWRMSKGEGRRAEGEKMVMAMEMGKGYGVKGQFGTIETVETRLLAVDGVLGW